MVSNRKVFIIAGILAMAPIAGIYLSLPPAGESANFATAQVTRGDLQQNVLAVGRLRAKELVAMGAQVSGQVTRLYVTPGQQVKTGDLIAEVDATPQELGLRNAEAAVASLQVQLVVRQAALAQAELAFRRQEALLEGDATTVEEVIADPHNVRVRIIAVQYRVDVRSVSLVGGPDARRHRTGFNNLDRWRQAKGRK